MTTEERDGVPRHLALAAAWSWRLLLVGAVAALAVFVLTRLVTVVLPVIVALFLAATLEPLVTRLQRSGVPRTLGAALVFLGALGSLVGLFWWLGVSVAGQFDELGEQLSQAGEEVQEWLVEGPLNVDQERIDAAVEDFRGALDGGASALTERLAGPARVAIEVAGGFVLMLFVLFFVLKDGERMAAWMLQRVPPAYRTDARAAASRARLVLRQYFVATSLTGLIDALLIGLGLVIVGVPLVLPLMILTFLGAYIPLIGAFVAGLVAALVALVSGGPVDALVVVGITVVVQQVEGNLLQPLVFDRVVRLHPLVIACSVAAGLILAGVIGAFLAVPLVATGTQIAHFYRDRHRQPVTV